MTATAALTACAKALPGGAFLPRAGLSQQKLKLKI